MENIEIIPFNKESLEKLNKLLAYPKNRGYQVFENLLQYLVKLNCRSIIVEKDYIDKDFRSEYSGLYSKSFKRFDNYCVRLHFWKEDIKIEDIPYNQEKYLGYITIRPIDVGKIGKTIIKPWIKDMNRIYPLCICNVDSHLLGTELKIQGCPFIQQDTMVMSCAHASLWMATRYIHMRFETPEFLPFDIIQYASRSFTLERILPTEGLTFFTMFNTLKNMGYSPIYQSREKNKSWDRNSVAWIYTYIESCIPVILTTKAQKGKKHAITVIGHTFSPKRFDNIVSKAEDNIIGSYKWVDAFIIHDDSLGPYRLLPITEHDKKLIEQEFPDMLASKGGLYNTFTEDIDGMIVPVPEKVYILGEYLEDMIKTEVLDIKKQFINDLCTIVKTMPVEQTVAASTFLNSLLNLSKSPIVLRTYLIPSVKYKESLTKEPLATEMHEIVRDKYKRLGMPRYIWVTEITTAEMMSKEIQSERKILGEIIVDATANKYSFSAFLAVHLPGMLAINDINKKIDDTDKNPLQKFLLPNDKPYSHAIRG